MNLKDITLDQIRVVTLYFVSGGQPTVHMVLATELDRFIEATTRLHFNPGVNPVNGRVTSRLERLTVAPLYVAGPYWWSTPSLDSNDDPNGAHIIQNDACIRSISFIEDDHDD